MAENQPLNGIWTVRCSTSYGIEKILKAWSNHRDFLEIRLFSVNDRAITTHGQIRILTPYVEQDRTVLTPKCGDFSGFLIGVGSFRADHLESVPSETLS